MLQHLHQEQIIPASIEQVWDFFATPTNLNALTPPEMKFVTVGEPPTTMQAGQLYEYDISLFPGIWMRWLTEIRQVRFREFFADEQRFGPYRFFYHSHHFEPVDGGVKMIDHIVYDVGYGPLGWVLNKLLVRRKLNQIFTYRRHRISEIFPKPS